jgi:AI-2 transport protein TqsA
VQVEQRIQTVCLLILATVSVAATLYWLRPVMIPFVLAVFLAIGLSPIVEIQVDYFRAPRWLAILATLMIGFLILNLIGGLISASVRQMAAEADVYQDQLEKFARYMATALPLERFGIEASNSIVPISKQVLGNVGGFLLNTTNSLLGLLSQGLLVMIFLLFLLLGDEIEAEQLPHGWSTTQLSIRRYLITKTLISAATGILVGSVLAVLGIKLAMVFGLFAFLLNFIPSVGSIVATLLPIPVVIVSPDVSAGTAAAAIIIPAVIQIVVGNVIDPKVMGTSLNLHPVSVLLGLMIWGMLWGVVGMFLATPLMAILKTAVQRMELTAPLADLLEGKPPRYKTPL